MAKIVNFTPYDITGDYVKSNSSLFRYPYIYNLTSNGSLYRLNVISKNSELIANIDLSPAYVPVSGSVSVKGNCISINTDKLYFYAYGRDDRYKYLYGYSFCELDVNTFVCKRLYYLDSASYIDDSYSTTARIIPYSEDTIRVYHYYNTFKIGTTDYTYNYIKVYDINTNDYSKTSVFSTNSYNNTRYLNASLYYGAPTIIKDNFSHLEYGAKRIWTSGDIITKTGFITTGVPSTIDTLNAGAYLYTALFSLAGNYYSIGGQLNENINPDIIQINPNSLASVKIGESNNNSTKNPIVYEYNDNVYIIFSSDKMCVASITEYNLTYTFKDNAGNTLMELTDKLPVQEINLASSDNDITVTLTYIDTTTESIFYTLPPETNVKFFGLSDTPNSKRAMLVEGDNSISIYNNITFYPVYIRYVVPSTTFEIELYQNSAEVNRVDKGRYLVSMGSLIGALRDECSLITPSIVYQGELVPNFNYVYIPIFNRYYFVTSLSSVGKNLWRMELNCDVLMSYKDSILLLQGVISRQEYDFNPMLIDTELPTQNNPDVSIINIPSTVFKNHTNVENNFYNFVLTVIG